MSIKEGVQNRLKAYRNPVYLLYAIIGVGLLVLSAAIAHGNVGPLETSIFRLFNEMGDGLYNFFWVISLFGTIGMVYVVTIIALIRKHYATAMKIFVGGVGAYYFAYAVKMLDIRARPVMLLENVHVREATAGSLGFPSGHAAVATVLALTAYQYLPKRWHKPVTILAILVCVSRLYLGVHLPLDLVGGFAIGMMFGGAVNFVLGSRKFSPVSPKVIKAKLKSLAIPVTSVQLAAVDARGSTPYIVELEGDENLFVKVVGRENNIADWLFKTSRKIIYRRLEDEAPFMTAKRQLEHEAYVSSLAKLANVRTPQVRGIFEAEPDRWAHAQTAIPGKSLDKVDPDRITDKLLLEIWEQINIMHAANIVHRDLRCANVFLDNQDKPWIIDFGFSEASMPEEAKARDNVELLGSLATLVGAKRAVHSAAKSLDKKALQSIYPYLSYSVFSGATTKALKSNKQLLPQIRDELVKQTKIKRQKQVEMKRINFRQLFIIIAVVVFGAFLIPKIGSFHDSLVTLKDARWWLVAVGLIFSALTYFTAALAYKALVFYPIKLSRLFLISLASSFASKLAPGGTGSLALSARFLTKSGHNAVQAAAIAGINNLMGFVSVASLILLGVLFGKASIHDLFPSDLSISHTLIFIIVAALVIVVILVAVIPWARKKAKKYWHQAIESLKTYRRHPLRLISCYFAAVLITLCYCAVLYACVHAFGLKLLPLQVLIVFTVGMTAATVTPTPGGIGGAEAGLVAALTATGIAADMALTISLLYRLLTFWIPIIPGFIAFRYALNKKYI